MARAQNSADGYLNAKFPWNPTNWVTACCAAIEVQDRETALTCLELWDGADDPCGPLNVSLTAMKHGQFIIVKKILRRAQKMRRGKYVISYVVRWRELIKCAVLTCRSTAALKFIETEFLLNGYNGSNPGKSWRSAIESFAKLTVRDAVERGDRWLVATCLGLSPSLAPDSSVIVVYQPPPDVLWVIMSRLFDASEGQSLLALEKRKKDLRNLHTIASRNNYHSLTVNPPTRAMARILIKRGLESFPSFAPLKPNAYDFILDLKKKYSAGGEMECN